jgi:hypothetical protein
MGRETHGRHGARKPHGGSGFSLQLAASGLTLTDNLFSAKVECNTAGLRISAPATRGFGTAS